MCFFGALLIQLTRPRFYREGVVMLIQQLTGSQRPKRTRSACMPKSSRHGRDRFTCSGGNIASTPGAATAWQPLTYFRQSTTVTSPIMAPPVAMPMRPRRLQAAPRNSQTFAPCVRKLAQGARTVRARSKPSVNNLLPVSVSIWSAPRFTNKPNIGALTIRIRVWRPLYYNNSNKEPPPKIV